MSELLDAAIKAGDKIYFRGEKVESIEITRDKDEPPLKVDLAHTRASYLDTIAEQLNENQQIVVNDVKQDHENYGIPKFNAIHLAFTTYATGYYKDHLKNDEEFYQVLSTLIAWALEQEEE